MFLGGIRRDIRSVTMATGKRLKADILARRAAKRRAGLERAQFELAVIESQLRLRGLLE
jgi:hypothetical protein